MCPSGRYPPGGDPSASATRAKAPGLRPAFDVLDADRDGTISRDDLKAFFSSAPQPLSDEEIGYMISAANADRDGSVHFEEFERSVLGRCGVGVVVGGVMAEAFRVIDWDGDGKVGFGDLKGYLQMAGLPAGDEDVWGMIRAGGGGDDEVSFDDLLRILAVNFAGGP